jgi:hypothetical protein
MEKGMRFVESIKALAASSIAAALIICSCPSLLAEPRKWREEGWLKTDFANTSIKWTEIASGGPPKDGIPSIDRPKFASVQVDSGLSPTEAVIGLSIGADARAYPLRIMIWHEIVNDIVGTVPVAVTYCPLCNSAVVFDRRVDASTLDFGTTGKLRHSDLVMYDRQTESWWQQFTGEGIVGKYSGSQLKLVPARLESFADFKGRHPDGKVLVPSDPRLRDYGRNPYVDYDMAAAPFLYRGDFPKDIEAMARVVVVRPRGREPIAVALEYLRAKKEVRIRDITLTWHPGQASALHHWNVAEGRDIGSVIAQQESSNGSSEDVPYDVTFAFAVFAFHPDLKIIQ